MGRAFLLCFLLFAVAKASAQQPDKIRDLIFATQSYQNGADLLSATPGRFSRKSVSSDSTIRRIGSGFSLQVGYGINYSGEEQSQCTAINERAASVFLLPVQNSKTV
jgi:hypothetical protein